MGPWANPEYLRSYIHVLTYHWYGGASSGFTRRDVLDMTLGEIEWQAERSQEEHDKTADQIARANAGAK